MNSEEQLRYAQELAASRRDQLAETQHKLFISQNLAAQRKRELKRLRALCERIFGRFGFLGQLWGELRTELDSTPQEFEGDMEDRADTEQKKTLVMLNILHAWQAHPHMRLGQLLECATPTKPDLFQIEDFALMRAVEELCSVPRVKE